MVCKLRLAKVWLTGVGGGKHMELKRRTISKSISRSRDSVCSGIEQIIAIELMVSEYSVL